MSAYRCIALGTLAGVALFSSPASAELPVDCTAFGDALVDHSCFHARFGPYTAVTAVPRASATSAPAVSAVHTYFEVTLPTPTAENLVAYQVAAAGRVGAWAIFHDPRVPLRVERADGSGLSPLLDVDVPSCPFLPRVSVFQLGAEPYRFVLGPTFLARSYLVVENVDDFVTRNGRDRDGDGYGDPTDVVTSMCVPPVGYVQNDGDCDDAKKEVNPGATEICDGADQNCNGVEDDIGLPCRAGRGTCERAGTILCDAMELPARCSATAAAPQAEACEGTDQNCNGVEDGDETTALCSGVDAPRCVRVLGVTKCGCDEDEDCGDRASGRICDAASRRCVAGCVNLPGRNGCPRGTTCSSRDPAAPGRCGGGERECDPPCRAGEVCRDGSCASADSAEPGVPPSSSSGCGCNAGSAERPTGIIAAGLLLALFRRRRQERRG